MPRASRSFLVTSSRLLGLGALLLLTSCSNASTEGSGPAAAPGGRGRGGAAPTLVSVTNVVTKPMPVIVRAVGNVEASSTVEVRPQVTAPLLKVEFAEGQDVRAGQLLFTLDARPFEVAVKQAEATLARDTATATNTQAQLVRQTDLFGRGLIAKSDFETTTAQAAAAQATLAADRATLENTRLQLQYTKIHAPVGGRTGALLVHQGAIIRVNDTTPMVVINQMTPVNVSFAIPAQRLADLRAAQGRGRVPVRASSGASTEESTGAVSFVDNSVDASSDSVRVKATFANTDRRLWPGAFVDVSLQLSIEEHALVVPTRAVVPSQQGQTVYVVKADQTVEMRPVKVAWIDGSDVVIATGLKAGESVVTDGQLRLVPGATVSIKAATPPAERPEP